MADSLLDVFSLIASEPSYILLSLAGVVLGTILGALPGVSSTMSLAIMLPASFAMPPESAMIFLIAIFSSSVFGGSVSAILINIPGTPGAIVTQFEGYPMARDGKAGHALTYALFASTLGGLFGLLMLVAVAPVIAGAAMNFRSPEFAMAAILGLTMLAYASPGSTFRGLLVACIGLLCGMVGFDRLMDIPRFDYGVTVLQGGMHIVPVTVGVFGLAEVLRNLAQAEPDGHVVPRLGRMFPPIGVVVRTWKSILRGSALGTFIGAIPAAGSAIAVSLAYSLEMRIAGNSGRFGKGEPKGIAAPEAANNACVGGALVPMMTLGVPGDTMTAVLMGALIFHGLRPGPLLFAEDPQFVAVVYGALFLGILLTLFAGYGLIRLIVPLLRLPRQILMVGIALFCVAGSFAIRNTMADVYVMLFFGLVGYLLLQFRFPTAPLAFGLVLGPILEENLRRSFIVGRGSAWIFVERPIALLLLLAALAAVTAPLVQTLLRRYRRQAGGSAQ
jgi:putative tricarboxylic transport membrane protein